MHIISNANLIILKTKWHVRKHENGLFNAKFMICNTKFIARQSAFHHFK